MSTSAYPIILVRSAVRMGQGGTRLAASLIWSRDQGSPGDSDSKPEGATMTAKQRENMKAFHLRMAKAYREAGQIAKAKQAEAQAAKL